MDLSIFFVMSVAEQRYGLTWEPRIAVGAASTRHVLVMKMGPQVSRLQSHIELTRFFASNWQHTDIRNIKESNSRL